MKTSRQQLLEYIQKHRSITVTELSHALHMTQANVRHHLDILMERGVVEVTGQHPAKGKGRPARFFGPSEKSLGNNLDLLCSVLLQEVSLITTPEAKETFLRRVAERLLVQISSQTNQNQLEPINPCNNLNHKNTEKSYLLDKTGKEATISLTQRLYQAIYNLNQFHYQARWEAHAEAPRLILEHCPYLGIRDRHPEICQVDVLLLTGLLRAKVAQIAGLVKDRYGTTSCIFRVINR